MPKLWVFGRLPMRALSVPLLAFLAAAAAGPAAARAADDGDRIDTLGGSAHELQGSARCRGAKIRAMEDALILGFDVSVKNTAGLKMQFFVYEALRDDDTYTRTPSASITKTGTVGDTFGWESADGLELLVSAQKFYVLLACWDESGEVAYRGAAKVAPQDMAFGEYVGGTYFDDGSEPPFSFRPPTATQDYLVRVRSADVPAHGRYVPFRDTDPFLSGPAGGRPNADSDNADRDGPESGPTQSAPGSS